jgi:hypothetical protein
VHLVSASWFQPPHQGPGRSRGLPGGGRSPAEPVSIAPNSLLAGKMQGIFLVLGLFSELSSL